MSHTCRGGLDDGSGVCYECGRTLFGDRFDDTQGLEQPRTFAEFERRVLALLEPTAKGKGYSTTGVDGVNALYEFVQEMAGSGHALGEIVYKARRYGAKRNPEDLEKIAAWAWLAWKHHA